jgi:hypothetical protein
MKNVHRINQHIYITSDEQIKDGDWFWKSDFNMVGKADYTSRKGGEKIVLTNFSNLINDGVQTINDEFLEWFVKNPSCEEVEVEKEPLIFQGETNYFDYDDGKMLNPNAGNYKIILPEEEAKQETLEEAAERLATEMNRTPMTFVADAITYSEEDMINFSIWVYLEIGQNTGKARTNKELFQEWLEQNKKGGDK